MSHQHPASGALKSAHEIEKARGRPSFSHSQIKCFK
jgi:hypothetical protein